MAKTKSPKYQPGDRVIERELLCDFAAKPNTPGYQIAAHIAANPRRGIVTGLTSKPARNGRRNIYLQVLWDGCRTPSVHATCRVRHLDDAPAVEA